MTSGCPGGSSLGSAAGPGALMERPLLSHVLHDLLSHLYCLITHHVQPQVAIFILLVSEAGVSRGPFQVVFLAQVKSECVTPREGSVTEMTLVFRDHSTLVYSLVVLVHGVGHAGGVVTALYRAVVGCPLIMGLHVLPQVMLVLKAALTEVTGKGSLVTVAELDVDLQSGERGAGHVTQGTLDMVHMLSYVVSQQSLIGKAFVTMLTHQGFLWLSLSLDVVKELGVAGEHAAAGGAGHQALLSVAAQMLPQTVLDLKECITTFPAAEDGLLLVWERREPSAVSVHVHMPIEPLRVVKCTITVLPLAHKSL